MSNPFGRIPVPLPNKKTSDHIPLPTTQSNQKTNTSVKFKYHYVPNSRLPERVLKMLPVSVNPIYEVPEPNKITSSNDMYVKFKYAPNSRCPVQFLEMKPVPVPASAFVPVPASASASAFVPVPASASASAFVPVPASASVSRQVDALYPSSQGAAPNAPQYSVPNGDNESRVFDFLKIYDFDFSKNMDEYLGLFKMDVPMSRIGKDGSRTGSVPDMITKYAKNNIDANVLQLHGKLDISNFIRVPDNFYIVTFVRDDIVQYANTFATDVKKLSHGIAFYMITMWMLFLYHLTLKNAYDPEKGNILELYKTYYPALEKAKTDFYNRLFPIYYKMGRMNISSGFTPGRVSDYNIFNPGEIISDMILAGNSDQQTGMLVGITDVVSYFEGQVQIDAQSEIAKNGFRFPRGSRYSDMYSQLELDKVYPVRRECSTVNLRKIVDYMINKKKETASSEPTFLFINACRVMDSGFKLLKLKPEKTILFHNIFSKFETKLGNRHLFDYERFYADKKKLYEKIQKLATREADSDPKVDNLLLDIVFGDDSPFCIGSIEIAESRTANSVFLYRSDFPPEYRTGSKGLNTLLGVHLPFRNINGEFFESHPAGLRARGANANASFLPPLNDFFIPYTNGGRVLLKYISNYTKPFHPVLLDYMKNLVFNGEDHIFINMINGWEEYAREYFKPNVFEMLKKAHVAVLDKRDSTDFHAIYGREYRLFGADVEIISTLVKRGYQRGFIYKYNHMTSFHDSIDVGANNGDLKFFPYLTFIEYFLANFMYSYAENQSFFMKEYQILMEQKRRPTNEMLLLELSKKVYDFRNSKNMADFSEYNFAGDFKTYARVFTKRNVKNFQELDSSPQSIDKYYLEIAREFLHDLQTRKLKRQRQGPDTQHLTLYSGYNVLLVNYLLEKNFERYKQKLSAPKDTFNSSSRIQNLFV
jgi:hypothetical protein